MNTQAPAGWYPQPDGQQRYWDGSQWTEHFAPGAGAAATQAPAAATPTEPAPTVAAPAVPAPAEPIGSDAAIPATVAMTPTAVAGERPWYKKKRFLIPGAAVVAVIGISAIATAGGGGGGTPVAEPTATQNETPVSEPSESASAVPTTFTMPELVGMNLQDAQDSLQAVGSYFLDQTDASGQGRMQVDDDNWQVCTQDPAAGIEVDITATVQLGSVKLDESCDGEVAAEPDTSGLSAEQVQAVGKAEDYLAFTAFSKNGLIEQLKFDGFSKADATAAVETLTVDWTEQAALKGQEYLDFAAFSQKGLIDQLKYDKFTTKQAEAGVKSLDVDWKEQAALKAEDYLDFTSFSRKELIAQLKYEGFTTSQAEYGVKQAGL